MTSRSLLRFNSEVSIEYDHYHIPGLPKVVNSLCRNINKVGTSWK